MTTQDELIERLKTERAEERPNGLPVIRITDQHRDLVDTAMQYWADANNPPTAYMRGGELVRVRDDENGRPIIEAMGEAETTLALSRVADFMRVTPKGDIPCTPPRPIVQGVLAHERPKFPGLRGIVEIPTLRQDGSVLDTPGYDPATRLIYRPSEGLEIPAVSKKPTDAEVSDAVALICDDLLGDFPFEDAASKANICALVLERSARLFINGLYPIHLIDKPKRGTGASLLIDVIAMVVMGQRAALQSYVSDEDETRKQITASLANSPQFVVFDNVTGRFSSAQLSRATTSAIWRDRQLGSGKMVEYPNDASWVANGNNVQVGGDLGRRIVLTRLNARVEKPWLRDVSEFKHPDLLQWAQESRGRIISAALTLWRAWIAAGQPAGKKVIVGSFQEWANAFSGLLDFIGVRGFMGNALEFYEVADEEGARWSGFIAKWHQLIGEKLVTASEIARRIEFAPSEWGETVPDLPGKQSLSSRLSYRLRERKDNVFGNFILRRGDNLDPVSRTALWQVTPAQKPKDATPSFAVLNSDRRMPKDTQPNPRVIAGDAGAHTRVRAEGEHPSHPSHPSPETRKNGTKPDPAFQAAREELLRQARTEKGGAA